MLHKDLDVWKKSMDLVVKVYQVSNRLPDSERYGLISQLNRAAVSVPTNIAEGAARSGLKDYIKFLNISSASLTELETLMIITEKIYSIPTNDLILEEVTPVKKMLNRLQSVLRAKLN